MVSKKYHSTLNRKAFSWIR